SCWPSLFLRIVQHMAPDPQSVSSNSAPQPLSRESMAPGDSGSDEGKYVYCIIRSSDEREFGPIGIGEGGNRVYTVHHRDLAAVVSDTPIRIYDPTREN